MEAASKSVEVPLALEVTSGSLSRGANKYLTPARTCEDRRNLFDPAVAGRELLGVPYLNRP